MLSDVFANKGDDPRCSSLYRIEEQSGSSSLASEDCTPILINVSLNTERRGRDTTVPILTIEKPCNQKDVDEGWYQFDTFFVGCFLLFAVFFLVFVWACLQQSKDDSDYEEDAMHHQIHGNHLVGATVIQEHRACICSEKTKQNEKQSNVFPLTNANNIMIHVLILMNMPFEGPWSVVKHKSYTIFLVIFALI